MANKKWFHSGKEGIAKSKMEDEAAKTRRDRSGPMRFYLENNSSAKVTFLDTPLFFVYEHNMKIGNKYHNYFTCIREDDTCPMCESDSQPSYIIVGTIINHSKYEKKDGTVVSNQKQLFVAKGKAREVLVRKIEKRGEDIKFCVFEMTRGSSATECNTGEDVEFVKKLTKAELLLLMPKGEKEAEWLAPFDYEAIFNPKTAKELRKILGMEDPVGAESDGDEDGDGEGDEDGDDDSKGGDDDGEDDKGDDDDDKGKDKGKGKNKEKAKEGKGKAKEGKAKSIDDLI